jgi:hypothetical protein
MSPKAKMWAKLHANRLLRLQFYVVKLARNHALSDDPHIQTLKNLILHGAQDDQHLQCYMLSDCFCNNCFRHLCPDNVKKMQAPCGDMDTDNPETTALDAAPGVADPELPVLQISSDAIVQTAHCARSPARAERVGQERVNHVDVKNVVEPAIRRNVIHTVMMVTFARTHRRVMRNMTSRTVEMH